MARVMNVKKKKKTNNKKKVYQILKYMELHTVQELYYLGLWHWLCTGEDQRSIGSGLMVEDQIFSGGMWSLGKARYGEKERKRNTSFRNMASKSQTISNIIYILSCQIWKQHWHESVEKKKACIIIRNMAFNKIQNYTNLISFKAKWHFNSSIFVNHWKFKIMKFGSWLAGLDPSALEKEPVGWEIPRAQSWFKNKF